VTTITAALADNPIAEA